MNKLVKKIAVVIFCAVIFAGTDYIAEASAVDGSGNVGESTVSPPADTEPPPAEQPEEPTNPSEGTVPTEPGNPQEAPSEGTGNSSVTPFGSMGNSSATPSGSMTNSPAASSLGGNTNYSQPSENNPGFGNTGEASRNQGSDTGTARRSSENTRTAETTGEVSADNSVKLKSLSVQDAALSPEFSPDTLSYQVKVEETTREVLIRASASDSDSLVIGTGAKEVEPGINSFKITCRNRDGDEQVYTVEILVGDMGEKTVEIDGEECQIIEEFDKELIPSTFAEAEVQIENAAVEGIYSKAFDVYGVAVASGGENISFRIVENGSISDEISVLELAEHFFLMRPVAVDMKLREGYEWGELRVGEQTVYGWTHKKEGYGNLIQLYLKSESGEEGIFQYDTQENTIIKYSEDIDSLQVTAAQTGETYGFFYSYYTWIFIAVVMFLGLALVIFVGRES